MGWLFGTLAVTLTVGLLWGLCAPRSQWRALMAWSVANPHAAEPGEGAYRVRRLACAAGLLGVGAVVLIAASSYLASVPRPARALTAVQVMWGSPEPQTVNRVVNPLTEPPTGLVEVPVLGYQPLTAGAPAYLGRLRPFSRLGSADIPGYIGRIPDVGFSAFDTATLIVKVRGPVLCVPRAAVALETETTVQLALYYGLPDSPSGAPLDHVAGCPADSTLTAPLLIPLQLHAPIGDRKVEALDGTAIGRVRLVG